MQHKLEYNFIMLHDRRIFFGKLREKIILPQYRCNNIANTNEQWDKESARRNEKITLKRRFIINGTSTAFICKYIIATKLRNVL